jgi:hypothetical protein
MVSRATESAFSAPLVSSISDDTVLEEVNFASLIIDKLYFVLYFLSDGFYANILGPHFQCACKVMQLLLANLSKAVEEKTEAEEKAKRFGEGNVKIDHNLADIIRRQKMKTEEENLKMKKIKNMPVTKKIAFIIL